MRVCSDEWFINLSSVLKRRTKEIIYINWFERPKLRQMQVVFARVIIAFWTEKSSWKHLQVTQMFATVQSGKWRLFHLLLNF